MALRNPFDKRKHRKFKAKPKPGLFPATVSPFTAVAMKTIMKAMEKGLFSPEDLLDIYKVNDDLMIALVPTSPRHIFGVDTTSILPDEASDAISPLIEEDYRSGQRN